MGFFFRYGAHYLLFCHYVSAVGPCHHGVARTQVAGGGTATIMEGRCEYIE